MYSFLVHTRAHSRLCREDSDFLVSTIDNCLSSRYSHSEYMPPDEYRLLHRAQRMDTSSIAGKYDDICSTCKESLNSYIREGTYLFS